MVVMIIWRKRNNKATTDGTATRPKQQQAGRKN